MIRLLEQASRLIGAPIEHIRGRVTPAQVDVVLAAVEDRLRAERFRRQPSHTAAATRVLSAKIGNVRSALHERELARRDLAFYRMHVALETVRSFQSIEGLMAAVPQLVVDLGFDRALLSRESGGHWLAQAAASVNGQDEANLLVAAGSVKPLQPLASLFERAVVSSGRTLFERGIRGDRRVHTELGRLTESDSFISAPIRAGSRVTAFVNIDLNTATGSLDEHDRDVMMLFTAGAGLALELLSAQRQLHVAAAREPSLQNVEPGEDDLLRRSLTRREYEVLELLAEGMTNRQIGEVLMISEATAITHVKRVISKLSVSNRTEAAGLFHRRHR